MNVNACYMGRLRCLASPLPSATVRAMQGRTCKPFQLAIVYPVGQERPQDAQYM